MALETYNWRNWNWDPIVVRFMHSFFALWWLTSIDIGIHRFVYILHKGESHKSILERHILHFIFFFFRLIYLIRLLVAAWCYWEFTPQDCIRAKKKKQFCIFSFTSFACIHFISIHCFVFGAWVPSSSERWAHFLTIHSLIIVFATPLA